MSSCDELERGVDGWWLGSQFIPDRLMWRPWLLVSRGEKGGWVWCMHCGWNKDCRVQHTFVQAIREHRRCGFHKMR